MAALILTAYDGRTLSAVRVGEQLARRLGLPQHVAVAYSHEPGATVGELGRAAENEQRFEAAEGALEALSLDPETTRSSLPAQGIAEGLLQLAVELGAAAIVLAADRHGHVTREVLGHATCPVVVAPYDPLLLPDRLHAIGVAFDGSPASRFALTAARQLASGTDARLDIVAVGHDAQHATALRRQVDEVAASPGAEARGLVRRGHAADELRRACEHLDLMVCGSRNRGALLGALLGSVSSRLVDDPVSPVMVVPVRARRDGSEPMGLTIATRT